MFTLITQTAEWTKNTEDAENNSYVLLVSLCFVFMLMWVNWIKKWLIKCSHIQASLWLVQTVALLFQILCPENQRVVFFFFSASRWADRGYRLYHCFFNKYYTYQKDIVFLIHTNRNFPALAIITHWGPRWVSVLTLLTHPYPSHWSVSLWTSRMQAASQHLFSILSGAQMAYMDPGDGTWCSRF